MRYIFYILFLSFFFGSCFLDTEPACEERPHDSVDFDEGLINASSEKEAWSWFLASKIPDSSTKKLNWDWIELGPTKTPSEGESSDALQDTYRGRGNGTGRINKIVINSNCEKQVFACSPAGGLFCSRNYGGTWENAGTDKLPVSGVSSVSINPEDSANWIISTGDGDDEFAFSDGVYRTFNSGKNWEQINGSFEFKLPIEKSPFGVYVSEIVSHPCDFNRQFLASNKGLYKCGNALDSIQKIKWMKVSEGAFYDIEISPHNKAIVLVGGEELLISRDCGKSFKKIKKPELEKAEKYGLVRMSVEFDSENQYMVYIALSRQKALGSGGVGTGFLFEFNIITEQWRELRELRKAGNIIPTRGRAFEISPKKKENLMLLGNVKPVYRSTDKGVTFEKVSKNQMHDDIHDFEFFSNGKTILAAHDGGVSKSEDFGNSWSLSDDGIGAANIHGLDVSSGLDPMVIYGAYDTGTTLYKNGTWQHVGFGDGFQSVIDHSDSTRMVLSMQKGGLFYSENASTFDRKARPKGLKASWHTWVKQNPIKPNALYVSGNSVARSLDFGESWELICEPKVDLKESEKPWRFYLNEIDSSQMYVVALGKNRYEDNLYYSSNINDTADVKWVLIDKLPFANWVSSVLPTNDCETCHYISFISYEKKGKLFYYNGESYQNIDHNLGRTSIRSGAIDKRTNRIYIGTSSGVYSKSHETHEWVLLGGLPSAKAKSIKINYATNELYVGTFGRGVWKAPLYLEP